jgi:hypothetical protein
MHFGFEIQTLKMCLLPNNLLYPTFYDSKNDSFDVTICHVEQLPQ